MTSWANPQWLTADQWRYFVRLQPVAQLCRDALSQYIMSLDWKITARDSEQQDELKSEIKHYTELFERGNSYYSDYDFATHIERLVQDLYDLPFGAASEVGRENDDPNGKVVWIRPLDGGTLAPTLDADFPVVQHFPNWEPVFFPRHAISRIFLSPRPEVQREGWGMAPPEKIYLAMEMLNRGDIYYSKLLLNTPEAGILDLGDTDQESANAWVEASRDLFFGIEPLKIPVLAEHTTPAKWIPFGKLPSEILYDSVTARYITIVTSGYGLTPSDIGFASSSNGGETLSGTIRQERRSAKSGKSLTKKKIETYFNKILPETLKFDFIDFDDEKNVAVARARMANANAINMLISNQIFGPDELRRQTIADGLVSITVPETIDRSKIEWPTNALRYIGNKPKDETQGGSGQVGSPKAPSSGGQGDVQAQQIINRSRTGIEVAISKAVYGANQILGSLINSVRTGKNDFSEWEKRFESSVVGKSVMDLGSESIIDDTYNFLSESLSGSRWFDSVSADVCKSAVDIWNRATEQRVISEASKRAEMEFIAGERDDLLPENVTISRATVSQEMIEQVKTNLLETLIPEIILISEKSITGYKFEIDTTDITDNSNIKLARSISEKVLGILPKVIGDVGNSLIQKLGDN